MVLYFCKESQNYFNSFATLVPIGALRWYRFMRYDGTVSPILSILGYPLLDGRQSAPV